MKCQVWYTLGEPDDEFLWFLRWRRRYSRFHSPLFTFSFLTEHVSSRTILVVVAVVVVNEYSVTPARPTRACFWK